MATLARLIATAGIKSTSEWVAENPNMENSDRMSHYRVTLRMGCKRMVVLFSMGLAITKEPTAADVLDCLASDAASMENARSFEDWAVDMGLDSDSRKAERLYRIIQKQAARLESLLGRDLYERLLYKTDRL